MKKAFCRNRDEIQEKLRIPIVMQSILNVTLYRHMLYPESISGNFSYKTQLVKKKKDVDRRKLLWTFRYLYTVIAGWQPAIFYFEWYKTHIHPSLPST